MSVVIGNIEDTLFFPYNSEETAEGVQDRLYDSQDWADYFRQFIGNGVFPNPSNGLQVESRNNSMVLTVRMGSAFINGRFYLQRNDFTFAVDQAHLTQGRRDIVVVRHDIIARTTQVMYIKGNPASSPQVPQIVRNDDVFDLQLCTVTVNPNAQLITQANILDTRLNSAVCGIVHGVVNQVSTTSIFNQYQTYMNDQISLWNSIRNTQESQWNGQTTQQQSTWQTQTNVQQTSWNTQTQNQQSTWQTQINSQKNLLDTLHAEMTLTYHALETQSFALINNNFDDWSVKRGCDILTVFNANGSITETITVIAVTFLLARRDTVFNADDSITETVTFYPWSGGAGGNTVQTTGTAVTKKTVFNADGSIREEIR
jgi:hypothetical protein